MLAEMYAHIVSSRDIDDNEAPKWDCDPYDADLEDETRQDAGKTLVKSCDVDRNTLPNPFLGTGAQFDDKSTDFMNPVSAPFLMTAVSQRLTTRRTKTRRASNVRYLEALCSHLKRII